MNKIVTAASIALTKTQVVEIMSTGTLPVPGATLFYRAGGSGAERNRAVKAQEDMEVTFQREGAAAAFRKLAALAGVNYEDREPDAMPAPPTPQRTANMSFFFAYDSPAVRRYHADVAALAASPACLIFACGRSAPDSASHRATVALAAKLGDAPVEFPGDQLGWLLHPKSFAARLNEILSLEGCGVDLGVLSRT
jgi:hypothetical protein